MINYFDSYENFLKRFLKPKCRLKIIFDCSNGAASLVINKIFKTDRRFEIKIIGANPDGNFPDHGPNPSADGALDNLVGAVKKYKADLGVIFDGDGDRAFFVDNLGRPVDRHEIGYALMQMFKPPYVICAVSSRRLQKGKNVFVSKVGHYHAKKMLRAKKADLGIEASGHYYFKNFFYCDSGIFTAIQMINFVSGLKSGLAGWLDGLPEYYRIAETNMKVKNKISVLSKIEKEYRRRGARISKFDGITAEFKDWWLNVRPSHTEDVIRVNIEAEKPGILGKETKKLLSLIK